MQIESFKVHTPIGLLYVFCSENKVLEINIGMDSKKKLPACLNEPETLNQFAKQVKNQLEYYFVDSNASLAIETYAQGTDFQKSVWQILRSIKKGKTLTYSAVAEKLGSSPRAVGNACRANPVPIIVPCHRVVAKSGLGGFAGQSTGFNIDMKTWLLTHEQVISV